MAAQQRAGAVEDLDIVVEHPHRAQATAQCGVSNLFVTGASAFPHNSGYNPTGPVGALAYMSAGIIRDKYLKNPGALI